MKPKLHGFLTLFIALLVQISFAQERTVTGVVSDNKGLPIPSVNVLVKGTDKGTQTDMDGKFSIKVSPNQTLLFNFVGMKSQEIVASSTTINVKMQDAAVELEDVVVTALGIKREKKSLGYGLSTISSENLIRSGETNAIEALAGKSSGVLVTGAAGVPGASSKVIIRGIKSITNTSDPLIIVDGVPFNNDTQANATGNNPFNPNISGTNLSNRALDLNVNDIESVSILKGGAAAALYGERAGNGVIIYTTKKGRNRKGIGVDFSFTTNMTTVNKLPKLQKQYAAGSNGSFTAPADPGPDGLFGTDDDVSNGTNLSWGPAISSVPGISYHDNASNFFQTGYGSDTNVAFYGGDKDSSFRTSFGYTTQDGTIPNSGLTKTNITINGDRKLTDKLKVIGANTYVKTTTSMVQNGSNLAGVMLGLLRAPASFDLANYTNPQGYQNTYYGAYDNPFYTTRNNPYISEVNRAYGNLGLVYNHSKQLNTTLRGSWDSSTDDRKQAYSISSFGNDAGDGTGQINLENIKRQIFNGDLIFNGNITLTDHINFNYTAGGNLRSDFFTDNFMKGTTLSIPNFYNMSNASNYAASNYEQKMMARSAYGQVDFSLYDQIYATGSIRNDWNSTYGDKKNFYYPSGSVAWLFSKPVNEDWLTLGKIRYGYADVGVAPLPYLTQTYYSKQAATDGYTNGNTVPFGGQNGVGLGVNGTIGNPNLKPERVSSNEIGLDLRFFNRLGFSTNIYQQNSRDLLIQLPLAPSSGYASQYGNYASLRNRGIEVDLDYDIIKQTDFKWNLSLNWSKNKNEVTSIANGINQYELEAGFDGVRSYAVVGQPLGVFYGTDFLRDTKGNIIIGANGLPSADPVQKKIGNPNPDWFAGIRNSISYKNLTLSALLDIRHGGDVWDATYGRLQRLGATAESAANRDATYVIPGVYADGTKNQTPITAQQYFQNYKGDLLGVQSQNVENVNWVRLRDISLTYRFKGVKLSSNKKDVIQYIDIILAGRNLWLNTNYKGVDPETSLTGAGSHINGFDYFNNPGSKSGSLSLKIGF